MQSRQYPKNLKIDRDFIKETIGQYTINELSEKFGVTKQAIGEYLRKQNLTPKIERQNKLYVAYLNDPKPKRKFFDVDEYSKIGIV